MQKITERRPFLLLALSLGAMLFGMHLYFCQAFSIPENRQVAAAVITVASLWFTFLSGNPFVRLEKKASNKIRLKFVKRPISFLLLLVSIAGLVIWSLNLKSILIRDAQILLNFIQLRIDRYYQGTTTLDVMSQYQGEIILLHLIEVVLAMVMGWICFRWRRLSLGLFPCGLLVGAGLFLGKAPGMEAMLWMILGGLGISGMVSEKSVGGSNSFRQLSVQKRGTRRYRDFVLLGVIAITLLGSALFLRNTEERLLEREEELLEFQHGLEEEIGNKTVEMVQRLQKMTGIGDGILSNTAPKYSGDTMLKVTIPAKPKEDIYLRGFTGNQYENGRWYEETDTFYNEFSQKQAITILNQGYHYASYLSKVDRYDMSIKYTWKNHDKYSLVPYFASVGGGKMPDIEEKADLSILRGISTRSYRVEYFAPSGKMLDDSALFLFDSGVPGEKAFGERAHIYKKYNNYVQKNGCLLPQNGLEDTRKLAKTLKENGNVDVNMNSYRDVVKSMRQVMNQLASYSQDLDQKPYNLDYVEYFLFYQKKGFCEHFATAGAVLFRAMGVPARYASGYRISTDEFQQNPDGTFTANVPDSDSHAWTEVYLDNFGWQVADMTPSSEDIAVSEEIDPALLEYQKTESPDAGREENLPTPTKIDPEETLEEEEENSPSSVTPTPEEETPEIVAKDGQNQEGGGAGNSNKLGRREMILFMMSSLLFLLLLSLIMRWRGQPDRRKNKVNQAEGWGERLLTANRLLEEYLRYSGWRGITSVNDKEYIYILEQIKGSDSSCILKLYLLLEKAAFDRKDITEEEYHWAIKVMKQLGRIVWEGQGKIRKLYLKILKNY